MDRVLTRGLLGYAIGVATFAILQFVLTISANYIARTPPELERVLPWLNVMAYLFYVVAGFLAATLVRRRQIINGAVVGALAATIAMLLFHVSGGNVLGVAAVLINGVVLGGIGGACTLALRREKNAL